MVQNTSPPMYRTYIQVVFVFLFLLTAEIILFLDIVVLSGFKQKEPISVVANAFPVVNDALSCSNVCQSLIDRRLDTFLATQSSKLDLPQPSILKNESKEFYIPLGVGMTRSNQYAELFGAEASIDSRNYATIKQVTFEVFLRNPTGNGRVYAKLFNVTDKHDVWFSEVFMEGDSVTKKEAKITIDPGNKLYRVMLQSTLGYDAYVDAARVKIVTQ